jgi:hypothetical protein
MKKAEKTKKTRAFAAASLAVYTLALLLPAGAIALESATDPIAPAHSESAEERIADAIENAAFTGPLKTKFFDPCLKRFDDQFKSVGTTRLKLMKLKQGDAEKYCEKNHNQGNPALNNKVNGPAPRLSTQSRTQNGFPSHFGACEMSIEATRISFEALTVERLANCHQSADRLTQFTTCMEKSDGSDTCNSQYRAIVSHLQVTNQKNLSLNTQVHNYVKNFPALNQKAIDRYKEDQKRIEAYFNRPTDSSLQPASLELAVAENRLPAPSRGGAESIEIYSEKLGISRPSISATTASALTEPNLLKEQEEAHELAKEFSTKLADFKSKEHRVFQNEVNDWTEKIKNPTDNTSMIGKVAPIAGPAMGAAGQLMGGAAAAPAAAAAVSGASALPALGAVAAASAALGGAAARANGGASGASESPFAGAQPNPLATPGAAALFDEKPAPAAAPNAPIPSPEPLAIAGDQNFSSPAKGALGSSGSSLKNGGRLRPAEKPNAATAQSSASEMPASFGSDLRPSPRPKKDDGMGEVSSLLGQMKNLFNFDEGAGMGGSMPLDMPGGTENPTRSIASDDYSSAGGEYENTEENYEEAQANYEVVEGSGVVSANGSSLFKRVHERHRICLEKGWVLHGLGGIPE